MIERSRFLIRTVHWLESFPDIKEDAAKRDMPPSLNDGLHFIRRRHRDNGKLYEVPKRSLNIVADTTVPN
jgi:hypothetical protein